MEKLILTLLATALTHPGAYASNIERNLDNGNKADLKTYSPQCEEGARALQACARELETHALKVQESSSDNDNTNEGADPGVGGFHAGVQGAMAAVQASHSSLEQKYLQCVRISDAAEAQCRADLNAGKNIEAPLNNMAQAKNSLVRNLETTRKLVQDFQRNLTKVGEAAQAVEKSPGELGSLGVP